MKNTIALYLIAVGITVIALQNAGIISPLKTGKTQIDGIVAVKGNVSVENTVNVQGSVDVDKAVNVNLSQIVGREIVESEKGMFIGVSGLSNNVIPIHWGTMDVDVQAIWDTPLPVHIVP